MNAPGRHPDARPGCLDVDSIVLHLPVGASRLDAAGMDVVRSGVREAVALAAPVLGVSNIDIVGIDSPNETIPGWGCGGYTNSAHTIVLALDPNDEGLTAERVRATVVHELHHVARERGPGCGTSLRERIVSEGLAMLFEEQILGVASEFAHVDIADSDIDEVIGCLDQDPADDGRWFFHSGDVPLWFGYTLGYRWAKTYAAERDLSASDLAHTPAAAFTARL